jgi:glycerophosphoryl diester phosphodiesterase
MKAVLFQPPYPPGGTPASARRCLAWLRAQLSALKPGRQQLILLPEYATTPGLDSKTALRRFAAKEGAAFLAFAAATARRLRCLLVINGAAPRSSRWFNRTFVFTPDGELACTYDKLHLTAAERDELGFTPGALHRPFTHRGVRFGFATCFDICFPEHFAVLAAQRVDAVLCPGYQRSETAARLHAMAQARAIDTSAWLLRSSYAMPDPALGGRTLLAAPDGSLHADAGAVPAVTAVSFSPRQKFIKPASHGRPPVEHRALLEAHRRPALYRPHPEFSAALQSAPFPRLCAHRGLSQACPENTLPAFAAAIAAGAHEIEFDLRESRDGVLVVCHDATVDRTTDGTGRIAALAWTKLRRLDAGARLGAKWRGVRLPCFEDVLDLADGRVALNIHLKSQPGETRHVRAICDLLRTRGLTETAYLALETEPALAAARDYAPEIARACLVNQADEHACLATALRHDCRRIQFFRNVSDQALRAARRHGLIRNLFWSDDLDDARAYAKRGIDVILSNCANLLHPLSP